MRKVIFVGGAPRAGTTVAHALICTAPSVSRYSPEISFFRQIPMAYRSGMLAWPIHTSAFFPDQEAYRAFIAETAWAWLERISKALGDEPILCVKDPLLTPYFPELHRLLPEQAHFALICRHPYAVVRSRQQVHEKEGRNPFSAADARDIAEDYMATYRAVLSREFGDRLAVFRYEDLNTSGLQAWLANHLGLEGFDVQRLWEKPEGDVPDGSELDNDPWGSPKYYGQIDLTPRLPELAAEWRPMVSEICRPVMQRMRYPV